MKKIRISGFIDEVSVDLKEQINTIHEIGEEYICPRTVNGRNISTYSAHEFKKNILPVLEKENIKISSIGSPIGKVYVYDEIGFLIQLIQLKQLVKIAQLSNCKYIRMFSFFYKGNDPEKVFPTVLRKIKKFLKVVKGTGVKLLHENEKFIYGDEPQRVLKLYNAVNDPDFVLCFDASNYIQCKVDVKEAFDLLQDKTVYYHIKDCYKYGIEVPVGLGLGYYDYIIKTLKEKQFEGFFTLEPHLVFSYVTKRDQVYASNDKETDMYKTFDYIDSKMNVSHDTKVSKKDAYIWQYNNLKKLLKENDYE